MRRVEDRVDRPLVVAWCRNRRITVMHVENERKRTPAQAAAAKRGGMLKGAPDLIVAVPGLPPISIEVKGPDGAESAAQHAVRASLEACGWLCFVGRGKDAILWLQDILV